MKITKSFIAKLTKDTDSVLETISETDIVNIIQQANHAYYNTQKPLFSDDTYDHIREYLEIINPEHPILKNIGSVIGDETKKVKLPFFMGSLDKIKAEETVLNKFKQKYNGSYLVSEKLDGVSGLIYIKNCNIRLFTRGDGTYGQDVTHLMSFLKFIPQLNMINRMESSDLAVRGELICSKADFTSLHAKDVANARNMVSGIVNAKIPDLEIASKIQFVAYEVVHPRMKPHLQIEYLNKLGFKVVHNQNLNANDLNTQTLSDILVQRREISEFDMDGIVVAHDQEHLHPKEGNPQFAFAFKSVIAMSKAEVTVTNIEWNISKDGLLVPTILFNPVNIAGVSISRTHGFHAKYVKDNNIGPGSRLLIRRSGDVIPYIESVLSASKSGWPSLPDTDYEWDKTSTNIIVRNKTEDNSELQLKNLQHFFAKLDIAGLGPGNIKKLFDAGNTSVKAIFKMSKDDFLKVETFKEKMAEKLYKAIQDRKNKIDCLTLIVASNCLGRGLGETKIKSIISAFPRIVSEDYIPTINELTSVEGIQKTSAELVRKNLPIYFDFIHKNEISCMESQAKKKEVSKKEVPKKKTDMTGIVIVFTGFRSKSLEQFIISNNGEVKTTVSKKVTLIIRKDNEESTKVDNARSKGIEIINLSDFKEKYNIKLDD